MALALMIGWSPAPAAAQATGTLVGTVRDAASQRPLEAVQVYIGGTGIGALTNAAGRFLLLNVPAGEHELLAELVGYRSGSQTVTVAAGESVAADFGLQQTAITLDQIVVTGAGVATERRKLGNTIATLDASSVENAPVRNFSEMIAAREPGVQLNIGSGMTGEGANIRIRGSSSLSQINEPIIYVDGIRVNRDAVEAFNDQGNPSRLDDIPPESIERVEILKGAAAATLYGTEASNGVIQIFTKRGRAGAPTFSLQADVSAISAPTNRIDPLADYIGRSCEAVDCTDPGDAATLSAIQGRMQERFGISPGPFEAFQQDAIPEILGTGGAQTYSASVNGGSDAFQYFVSARWADEDGPFDPEQALPGADGLEVERDSQERGTFTANFTVIPSEKLRIAFSSLYSDVEHHTPDNGNNIFGVYSSMLMGQLRLATPQLAEGPGSNFFGNPAFATTRENMFQQNFVESQHFAGSTTIGFTPTDFFRLDGTFGIDFTSDDAIAFRPFAWNVDGFSGSDPSGSRTVEEFRSREITTDIKGSLINDLTDRFENTFLFGGQGFVRQGTVAGGEGTVFPGPGLEVLEALANQETTERFTRVTQLGLYLQDQIAFDDWVFLTGGGRWDANSAFGENFDVTFYPKVSISIVPSQGLNWRNDTFSTFRVRAAVGQSGLQPDAFARFTTFEPAPSPEGPGVAPDNLGNDELVPEVSTEWEVGTEIGLFNDRWSIDATYWNRTVDDALVSRQFSVTGGFLNEQLVNIGELSGQGLEIGLRGTLVQRQNFSVNMFANTAWLDEEITDLGGAPPLKSGGSYPRYRNFLQEGFTPGAFFGAKLADIDIPLNIDGSCTEPTEAAALAYFSQPRSPSDFKPLAVANSDFDTPTGGFASNNCGVGLLESFLGDPTPDFAGSFGFDVAFLQNFELSTLFEYKLGGQNQDLSGMFRRANAVIGRNTPRSAELGAIMQNPASTAQQRLDAAVAWAQEVEGLAPMSGLNGVFDADLMRWRELSLSYRVPSDLVENWGLSTATINFGARNLHLWVNGDYTGVDPETNVVGRCTNTETAQNTIDCNFLSSTEGWSPPIPRRFTLSTRVTF